MEYVLIGYEPYEPSSTLYKGSEEGLKEYINSNKKEYVAYRSAAGKEYKSWKIEGWPLTSLDVFIVGPEVRSYIE